jgi:hypothetical protein
VSHLSDLFCCVAFEQFVSLCHLRAIYFIVSPSNNLFRCVALSNLFRLYVELAFLCQRCTSGHNFFLVGGPFRWRSKFESCCDLNLQKSLQGMSQGSRLYRTTAVQHLLLVGLSCGAFAL